MNKNLKYVALVGLICVSLAAFLYINYSILINATGSLGNWAFIVKKGVLPLRAGEYVAFTPPANPYYTGTFVKIVGGVAGDKVTEVKRTFYINGKQIGLAKEVSLRGDALDIGPVGVLPQASYFVYTPHKDSYDSRYSQIGWISKDRVIGTAVPIL